MGEYSNGEVDRLLEEGRSETNVEKRKGIYAKLQQLLHDDGYMAVPYHSNYVTAMRRKVQGQTVHPLRYWDFRWTYLEA